MLKFGKPDNERLGLERHGLIGTSPDNGRMPRWDWNAGHKRQNAFR